MKQFTKIKQLAGQALARPPTTSTAELSEAELELERRLDHFKSTCEVLLKRITLCLQSLKESTIDKRMKKLPEYNLGNCLLEAGRRHSEANAQAQLGPLLEESGRLQLKLSSEIIEFENQIELLCLNPLHKILTEDIPATLKLKRSLAKATEQYDSLRLKLVGAGGRMSGVEEREVEEAFGRVEGVRDSYTTALLTLPHSEHSLSKILAAFLSAQHHHYATLASNLATLLPDIHPLLVSPAVFGKELALHLAETGRVIAAPIEICVCGLISLGVREEGLFRVASATSRLRRARLLLDSSPSTPLDPDPHLHANLLKSYLRSLPTPLLPPTTYLSLSSPHPVPTLRSLLAALPPENYANLEYIVRFLATEFLACAENRMTVGNLSIVIGPNLMWGGDNAVEVEGGATAVGGVMGGAMGGALAELESVQQCSGVLELMLENWEAVFSTEGEGEYDFFRTLPRPTAPLPTVTTLKKKAPPLPKPSEEEPPTSPAHPPMTSPAHPAMTSHIADPPSTAEHRHNVTSPTDRNCDEASVTSATPPDVITPPVPIPRQTLQQKQKPALAAKPRGKFQGGVEQQGQGANAQGAVQTAQVQTALDKRRGWSDAEGEMAEARRRPPRPPQPRDPPSTDL